MTTRQVIAIGLGVLWGLITRLSLLRVDYRAYPSYPHAYSTHLAFGFIASLMGSVAPVALAEGKFEAVSFLLLTATQFQEIRRMERDKLADLETIELVPRGANYIEGIAEVFEARNYLVMLVAALTSAAFWLGGPWGGVIAGVVLALGAHVLRRDTTIGDVAKVRLGEVRLEGPGVYVEDIFIMNVALPQLRDGISKWAIGVVLEAREDQFINVLHNVGQRQAIVHDVIHVLGNRQDVDTAAFQPMVRKDAESGRIAVYLLPMEQDSERVLQVVSQVPVLSNAKSGAGQGL